MAIPRRVGRVLAAVGVAGAAAAAGTIGLAAAQSSTTTTPPAGSTPPASSSPSTSTAPHPGGPRRGPGPGGPFGGVGFGGDVLHGEYVVPKSGGGYETLDTQTGKVTAVSSTAITVQSDDGFSKTYVVTESTVVNSQRDGIGSVANGDTVRVTATVSGSTSTAVDITDTTKVSASRGQWAPGRPARPATPPTSASGSTSTTTG